ncbi:uncharacterized protein SCHCODRAFT_02713517 [Schizophyllum commune H4-8]|nr:uncharacterized protein SCHCODRAFT_02713517 [Schizophyllum commune H4-8]KAI5887642.1 hypothetical protein SCHCODRAFT_02713517 [Schizophyllum commune H4-8]
MMHRSCKSEKGNPEALDLEYNVDSPGLRVYLLKAVSACLEVNETTSPVVAQTDRQLRVTANDAGAILSFTRAPQRSSIPVEHETAVTTICVSDLIRFTTKWICGCFGSPQRVQLPPKVRTMATTDVLARRQSDLSLLLLVPSFTTGALRSLNPFYIPPIMKTQVMSPIVLALMATSATAKILNDGTKLAYGKAFDNKVQWQMAGVLESPCTGDFADIGISDCYQFTLSADGSKNLDTGHLDSPRQRNEFRAPDQPAGKKRTYEWKTYVSGETGTSDSFFHLTQIKLKDVGPPLLTLSARKGKIGIESEELCGKGCASASWDDYVDRTVQHTMKITFGPDGSMDYKIKDADSGKSIISQSLKGHFGDNKTFLKFGSYRKAYDHMTKVRMAAGDYKQT